MRFKVFYFFEKRDINGLHNEKVLLALFSQLPGFFFIEGKWHYPSRGSLCICKQTYSQIHWQNFLPFKNTHSKQLLFIEHLPCTRKCADLSILFEKEMATHSFILAWRIPWTEESGIELQSMGSQSWTRLSNFHFTLYSLFHLVPQ